LSISQTPPVSLHAVRNNFEKSGGIGSGDRYVRDFNQLDEGEQWDLLSYAGQAFGLQYKIFNDGYGGGLSGGNLPLDEIDRRADGLLESVGFVSPSWGSYARLGVDDKGKYAELQAMQYKMESPGAMAMNGIFFASEAGPDVRYRLRATVETASNFSSIGEAGIFVFGYRYGYLDGDRRNYSLWGYGERPGPSKTLSVDETFVVEETHRHIVVNLSSYLGGAYNQTNRANFKVRDLTIERA
jgi:hypothetical protein